jgi:hypothetical protein
LQGGQIVSSVIFIKYLSATKDTMKVSWTIVYIVS